jgi:flagellar basal-body rod protein FlgG
VSYGLQISASGVMAAMYRQDVFTNNLANMSTPGFKPDSASTLARESVRSEDNVWNIPSNRMLEKLGGGVLLNANRVSFAQGGTRVTGNTLDVAIEGEGFFVVRDATDKDTSTVRLTRDGRFTRNSEGELVMATTGMRVLDRGNQPISIPATGSVKIDGDGTVRVNNQPTAQLALVTVPNKESLIKQGHSLFLANAEMLGNRRSLPGTVRQGALEESGVDEVRALMQMTSASREVDANVDMMRAHDRLLERAIASLGRMSS